MSPLKYSRFNYDTRSLTYREMLCDFVFFFVIGAIHIMLEFGVEKKTRRNVESLVNDDKNDNNDNDNNNNVNKPK